MKINLNIKQWTLIVLPILGLVGGYNAGYINVIGQVLVAIFVATGLNMIIDYFLTKKIKISDSAIITGLIISTVAAPSTPLLLIAFLSVIAIISKYFIRAKNRTIFNPAAFSFLIGILFFHLQLGWWADYNHYLTIILGSFLMVQYPGHWKMLFSFFITWVVLISVRAFVLNLPLIDELYLSVGISFFFMFFMLTDPKTIPLMADQFMTFGILVALGSFISALFFPSTIFILGLLTANLANLYLNALSLKKVRLKAQAAANAMKVPAV